MRMFRRGSVQLLLLFLSLFSIVFYVYYAKFYLPTVTTGLEENGGGNNGNNAGLRLGMDRSLWESMAAVVNSDGGIRSVNGVVNEDALSSSNVVAAAAAAVWNLSTLDTSWMREEASGSGGHCPVLQRTKSDIDTGTMYSTLNFNPRYKEYWNENFEKRYLKRRENWSKLPLKVSSPNE